MPANCHGRKRACVIREKHAEIEFTCGSGPNSVPTGVLEPQRDPGGGVVVLQRHLNADPSPLRDRRRHVQDDADAHLLRRGHEARIAPDQRGQSKTEEKAKQEDECVAISSYQCTDRDTSEQLQPHGACFFQRRSRSLYALRMQAARGDPM
jgi:hypothetical protein